MKQSTEDMNQSQRNNQIIYERSRILGQHWEISIGIQIAAHISTMYDCYCQLSPSPRNEIRLQW